MVYNLSKVLGIACAAFVAMGPTGTEARLGRGLRCRDGFELVEDTLGRSRCRHKEERDFDLEEDEVYKPRRLYRTVVVPDNHLCIRQPANPSCTSGFATTYIPASVACKDPFTRTHNPACRHTIVISDDD